MTKRPLKRMLTGGTMLLAILCAAPLAHADATTQPDRAANRAGRAGGRAGQGQGIERIRQVLDSLNLSADQKKQIDQILAEAQEDIAAMAKDLKGASPEDRREKLKPIIQQTMEKIRDVLTDEQKAELKQKMQERRAENGKAGGKAGNTKATAATGNVNADVVPPATQPIDTSATPVTRGPLIQRMHDRLAALDLSPEQQTKIDAVLDDTAKKIQAMRQDAQANVTDTRDKAKLIMQSTREQIASILTPEQKQKWQESAEPNRPPPDAPKATASAGGDMMAPTATPDTTAAKAAAASSSASTPTAAQPAVKKSKALYEGAPAPAFRLKRLSGSDVTLDSFGNRPVVLIFGSLTSPTFRDKAALIDTLSRKYRTKAAVLIVYTREAYPANEWDVQRNTDDEIKIAQSATLDDRIKLAKMAQQSLKIETDMAVDDVDDNVTDTYDAMPNNAYVLAGGKIVTRQKWADPTELGAYIDAALKKPKE